MDYDKPYQAYKDLGMGKKFEQHPDFGRYKKDNCFPVNGQWC